MVVVLLLAGLVNSAWGHPPTSSVAPNSVAINTVATMAPSVPTSPPSLPPPSRPGSQEAKVGMLVTQLYNFRPSANAFDAEFWLWSVEHPDGINPLKSSSFANAYVTKRSPEKEFVEETELGTQVIHIQKVSGTFRHDWNLIHFPFDLQHLRIILEEDDREASALRLVPDRLNTKIEAHISDDWRLLGFSLEPGTRTYQSRFGQHVHANQVESSFAQLILTIDLERTSLGPLWRLGAAPLAGLVIAGLSYCINLATAGALPARGGLIGAALFAEILSMRAVSGPIYNGAPLTLIERLHLLAIVYTIIGAAIMAWQVMRLRRGVDAKALSRLDLGAALISSLLLIPLVSLLLLRALHSL